MQLEPVKRVKGGTRGSPKYEDEKRNRGRRGGTVHVARDADAAKILEVCKTTDADLTLAKARAIEKAEASDGKTLRLSPISRETAEEIRKVSGVAPTSLTPTVGGNEIRHTFNRHGKHVDGLTKGEKQKSQVPITADDIARIGEVLKSYDSIEKGSPNVRRGLATETVKFKKKFDDGTVYTVFAVPANLQFRTMWKKRR